MAHLQQFGQSSVQFIFQQCVKRVPVFVNDAQEAGHNQCWGWNPRNCNNIPAYHFRMKIVQQVLLPIFFCFQFSEHTRHTKPILCGGFIVGNMQQLNSR